MGVSFAKPEYYTNIQKYVNKTVKSVLRKQKPRQNTRKNTGGNTKEILEEIATNLNQPLSEIIDFMNENGLDPTNINDVQEFIKTLQEGGGQQKRRKRIFKK